MKHRFGNKKLSLPTDQRLALIKNLVLSLAESKEITTTTVRAKQAKSVFEKLVTIAKNDSVHNRRRIFKFLNNNTFVSNIFNIAKDFKDVNGGYTRLIKKDIEEETLLNFLF